MVQAATEPNGLPQALQKQKKQVFSMFFEHPTPKLMKTQCFFILLEPVGIPTPPLINVTELFVPDFFSGGGRCLAEGRARQNAF